jgi:hypothetical protein
VSADELLVPRNARILLGVAMAASGALLIAWHSDITFLVDDWAVLLHRRGFNADAFLDPHARHLILGPAVVYKAAQATFGMEDRLAYAVPAIAAFLASVGLLFVYLSRRVGDWVALAAVLPVLVMGIAYEDLLSPFQIGYFGSMAFGIGALLAVERGDGRGDLVACALLLASLAFSEIAFAFAAGVAVTIALQRGPIRRSWVLAVPVALYALWYLTFGTTADDPSAFSLRDIGNSPPYVLNGFASSLASLLGLGLPPELIGTGTTQDWGRPLLVAAVTIATAAALRTRGSSLAWTLVPLAAGLAFWFATAANATNLGLGRPFDASRYMYVGAVFILMIAGALAAGRRPGRLGLIAIFAVAIAAALSNWVTLRDAHRAFADGSVAVRGGLSGLEIAADRVPPDFLLTKENSNFEYFTLVDAGSYLSAVEDFGSPAYSEAELASAKEPARAAADKVIAAALPVSLGPDAAPAPAGPAAAAERRRGCVIVGGAAPVVDVPAGGASLSAPRATPTAVALRRYATDSFPVELGSFRGSARLTVPSDRSSRRWQLQLDSPGPVRVCPA